MHLFIADSLTPKYTINQYGDQFKPTDSGHGVDIASQRQDELDLACLAWIRERIASGKKVQAVDLGGGFGAHSIQMAALGAAATMVDIADMATESFKKSIEAGVFPSENLRFIQKDFTTLTEDDIPENYDVLYSQRAIHYISYLQAKKMLKWMFQRMAAGGAIFISAAGWDTEYGKTYPDRHKPIEQRFNFVTLDMQQKHSLTHRITTYKEEDMVLLLKEAGFSEIEVTHSAFGNIKAKATKP